MRGDEPRALFAFAGIWRRHVGPVKKDGPSVELDVFSFLTTAPNKLTSSINHERMPVLLSGDDEFGQWMEANEREARGLIRSFAADRMLIVQRGRDKLDLLLG